MKRIRFKKQKSGVNKRFLGLVLTLAVLGLIAVADASAPQALNSFNDKFYFFKQQALWGALGVLGLFVTANIHYSFWRRLATPLFLGSIALLIAVLIPGVGQTFLGAKRWLILGPVSVQPSEIIKLTIILYLAKLSEKEKSVLAFFLPPFIVAGLIMLQPDLGTTIVVMAIAFSQIFLAGVNLLYIFGAFVLGTASSFLLIITSAYRRARLATFLGQTSDPLGKDYHIRQILLALGSGGLWGVGLGASRQKYLFLPEAATDSIFAVVAEETGFLGAAIVIILFLALIMTGIKIAKEAPDKFSQVLAVGIVSWIAFQVILNIGSITALTPLTGVPLPFFSYGGSALTMLLVSCGILLNISRH